MARVEGIKKRLESKNTEEKIIREIIGNGDLINIIQRMEQLIEPNIMREILDSCACTGGKKYLKYCENIGKEITGKTLEEKVEFLNEDSDDRVMPLSYCFCCAGSMCLHLQLKLGIELKAQEIVTSPINSKGEEPCRIIFEILSFFS